MITAANLTTGGSGTSSSENTASITPTAGRVSIVSVQSFLSGGVPLTPTITGCSMTWTQIATRQSISNSNWRITTYRGLAVTPTTGVLTINFGGTNNQSEWSVDEFIGLDIGGTNASNAIVQSASNDNGGTQTGITVALGAFSSINNATFGALVLNNITTVTVGGAFTQLGNQANNGRIVTEWANNNQTAVNFTWGSSNNEAVAMALELKAANSGGGGFLLNLL